MHQKTFWQGEFSIRDVDRKLPDGGVAYDGAMTSALQARAGAPGKVDWFSDRPEQGVGINQTTRGHEFYYPIQTPLSLRLPGNQSPVLR